MGGYITNCYRNCQKIYLQYHRWIFEKCAIESVESFREWIIQEAEFQTTAVETV